MINFIVAVDKNNVIGKDNKLPWRLPEDLKYFKKTTLDKTMIMGRKTFESLPGILPGRNHVVLTRKGINTEHPQVSSIGSVKDVLTKFKNEEIFVIGGSDIFKQFLPYVDKLFITHIDEVFEGDTYFPEINLDNWELKSYVKGIKDEKNPYDYSFKVYKRIENNG